MADSQNGKWPIPAFPKPQTYPNKAGGSGGKGSAYAGKRTESCSMNLSKAAELKAKQ
jgi:hypothetical protein